MHVITLCSALFGFAFLDAVNAATRTWPENQLEHCSDPLATVDASEDEAALLQADSLNLRSKIYGYGDYAPAKDKEDEYGESRYSKTGDYAYAKNEMSKYGDYHETGRDDEYQDGKSRDGAYVINRDKKDEYGKGQYSKTGDYTYANDEKSKYGAYHATDQYDDHQDGVSRDGAYAINKDKKDEYGEGSKAGGYAYAKKEKSTYDDYHETGKDDEHQNSESLDGAYAINKDKKDEYGESRYSKTGDYTYAKNEMSKYGDYHETGRDDEYQDGKSRDAQGRSYDGETDHYALLQVTGLRRAAGDVYPNNHDNGVHAQNKDKHDDHYTTSNHDGDYYGNSYDYAHSTAKDEHNDHDRPSAYGNGEYVESNYGKYEYYGEMDNDAHSKEGEYYGKLKDYAHAKGAEYYGKQEDSAYGQKKQYYGNVDNYAYAKAGKHYGKVDDYSYAKEGKFHAEVHDKYPKETTQKSYSYSDAEK